MKIMDVKQRAKLQKFMEDPDAYSKVLVKAHDMMLRAREGDASLGNNGESVALFYEWLIPPWLEAGIDHHIRAIVMALRSPIPVGSDECLVKSIFGISCIKDHGVTELTLRRKLVLPRAT